jgi:putative ATPase
MTEKASNTNAPLQPLAERMRPTSIDEVVGQTHLTNEGMPLARMLEKGRLSSIILWGPPGTGKTTLARILSEGSNLHFEQLSAVFAGVKDLKEVFSRAKERHQNAEQT